MLCRSCLLYTCKMLDGPLLQKLNSTRLCLASGSPRRRDLLNGLGLKFEVVPSEFDEKSLQKSLFPHPSQFVAESSRCKASEVLHRVGSEVDIIIAADTVVSFQGDILEKPRDAADAVKMLTRLSGQTHYVYTGVTLISQLQSRSEPRIVTFSECTKVLFADLTADVIASYVETKEPLDKAGSYGIQGRGGAFATIIEGNYSNVVGLPIEVVSFKLLELLDEANPSC